MSFLLQRTPIGFSARLSFPHALRYSAPALIPAGFTQYREHAEVRVATPICTLWVGGDVIMRKKHISLVKGGNFPVKGEFMCKAQYCERVKNMYAVILLLFLRPLGVYKWKKLKFSATIRCV